MWSTNHGAPLYAVFLSISLLLVDDLYSSLSTVRVIKSKRMKWVGHVARMGERRGVYRVLVEKPEGRTRRRWGDNIKMDHSGSGMWVYGLDRSGSG